MQLYVEFSSEGVTLPLAYRYMVQGLIYKVLSEECDLSHHIHNEGNQGEGKQFKLFSFGPLTGPHRVVGKNICFFDRISLEIRSCRRDMMLRLLQGLHPGQVVHLGDRPLRVLRCSLEDRQIETGDIWIQTCSPVVSYITHSDGHTQFFSPEEELFYRLISKNSSRKWISCFPQEPCPSLLVSPVDGASFTKQVTTFKNTRITAWSGQFRLQGEPKLLNFLYQTGLGAKNSQGFGLFRELPSISR